MKLLKLLASSHHGTTWVLFVNNLYLHSFMLLSLSKEVIMRPHWGAWSIRPHSVIFFFFNFSTNFVNKSIFSQFLHFFLSILQMPPRISHLYISYNFLHMNHQNILLVKFFCINLQIHPRYLFIFLQFFPSILLINPQNLIFT